MTAGSLATHRLIMVQGRAIRLDLAETEAALMPTTLPSHSAFPFPLINQHDWQQHFWRLAAETEIRDLTIDQWGRLWVDRGEAMSEEPWPGHNPTVNELGDFVIDLIAAGGRHIDSATPVVDVVLSELGGLRAHAVLPPISAGGPVLSMRRPAIQPRGLGDLGPECMSPKLADWLRRQFLARRNLLICGASGSGKTTLLAALLAEVPVSERIITIEDIPELSLQRGNFVQLCARQSNAEGVGGVSTRTLLIEALRMRPDRIVLGELRGAEFVDLLTALNTGHNGGAASCHASSLENIPARLEAMGALAGLGREAVAQQVAGAIDIVIQLERSGGLRRVAKLGRFVLQQERLTIQQISAEWPEVDD